MKSISSLKVNEAFQMKAYTKLMENLEVADKTDLSFAVSENVGEIKVVYDKNGGDIVFANGGDGGIICYYFQEKTATLSNVTVPLNGTNMVAGIDKNGLLYVFVIRDNSVYYSKSQTPYGMDFCKEVQLDVTLPKDFKSIEKLLLKCIDDGFALFVISGGTDGKTNYLTCRVWGDTYDYMAPVAFGKGELDVSGDTREELTVHLISNDYVKYGLKKGSLETFKLEMPAGISVKEICYAEKLYCLSSDNTIGIVKCSGDGASIIKLMDNASGDAFCVKKFGQYFHTVILGADLLHARMQMEGVYSTTSPCPIDLAVSDACFSPRDDVLTLFYYNKEEHVIVRLDYSEDDGNWAEIKFDAIQPGEVRRKPCYSTEIQFLHPQYGTPLSNVDVEVWTEDRTYLETESGLCLAAKDHKIKLNTGASGKIYFLQYTDKMGSSPVLAKLPESLMPADENLVFRQYEVATANFKDISADDIMNAKTTDSMSTGQDDLLKGDFRTKENAEALANGINSLMELHGQLNSCPTCKGVYIAKDREIPQLNVLRARDGLPSWSLTAEGGRLIYKGLTAAEAASEIAALKNEGPIIGGFFSSIGDFFRAIGKKIANVVKVVVNGLETVVTCVINGVKTVFSAIIKTINEVLEFIEAVFAVVLIFFVVIFAWLAALFQWADVKRTQKAIKGCLQIFLERTPEKADKISADLLAEVQKLKENLASKIDEICEKIAPDEALMQLAKDSTPDNPRLEEAFSNDILLRKLTSGEVSRAVLAYGWEMDLYRVQISSVIDVIKGVADNISASEAFDKASDYFEKAFKSIDGFFQNTFAALLKVVEGIMSLALDGAGAVIQAVFGAVKAMLDSLNTMVNKKISVPFFSGLYKFMIGDTMSLINLFSFVAAVPATTVYKMIRNKAPFGKDKEISDFTELVENAFISDGIGECRISEDSITFCSLLSVIVGQFYYVVTEILDLKTCTTLPTQIPQEDEDGNILDWTALILEWCWFGMSTPWLYKEPEKSITKMQYVQWGYFGLGCAIDTAYLIAFHRHIDEYETFGRVITLLYGIGHIIAAAFANVEDGFDVLLIPEYVGGSAEISKILVDLDPNRKWSVYPVAGLDFIETTTIFLCGMIDVLDENN